MFFFFLCLLFICAAALPVSKFQTQQDTQQKKGNSFCECLPHDMNLLVLVLFNRFLMGSLGVWVSWCHVEMFMKWWTQCWHPPKKNFLKVFYLCVVNRIHMRHQQPLKKLTNSLDWISNEFFFVLFEVVLSFFFVLWR